MKTTSAISLVMVSALAISCASTLPIPPNFDFTRTTIVAGDKRKYRVPSLNEFEVLWKKYKNDEHIGVFKKREYCTDGKHISSKSAYTQTFSFESGNSGQLYASYLTCVGK
jgi:hypothetical protein